MTPLLGMPGPLASEGQQERPSRSILDGVLKSLFPAGAYEGVLPSEALAEERRMQLRRAGLALMAGAGPRPAGTRNVMGDIASAIDPGAWEQRLGQVAQTSMQLRAAQQKQQREQQANEIMRAHAPRPAETPEQQDQRLLALANAFTQAGLMEHAKVAADLRTSLRAPPLGEKDGVLYDTRSGRVVGELPTALKTVEGSQLYAQALGRLQPWDRIRATVAQYNQFRAAPLTTPNSVALVSAAQDLLNTHTALAQNDTDMKALKDLPVVGQLMRVLRSLSGQETLSDQQRQELLKAVDPVINRLGQEHQRVLSDVQRIFKNKWSNETEYSQMWNLLPQSPPFNASGVQVPRIVKEMDDDRR